MPGWVVRLILIGLLAFLVVSQSGFACRRGPKPPASPAETDTTAVLAADMPGLVYLPPGANVALAVRPAAVAEYAARTGQDPVAVVTGLGVPPAVLGAVARAGLTLQDIDHVAGGAVIPAGDGPAGLRLTVALVLRRPVADEDAFLRAFQARRTLRDGQTRYAVDLAGLPLTLAKASPTTWVFGWSDADADPAGGAGLPPGLRELVAERLPPEAAAWAAVADADWADKPLVKLAVGGAGRKEWLPLLGQARAGAVGLTLGDRPRATAAVRCIDGPTGERLRAYFRAKATGDGAAGGAGEWATFDAPADPRAGFGAFKGMLDDAGK